MADIFIPTLHTFAMDNTFTGSCGNLRFRLKPEIVKTADNGKEIDFEKSAILGQFWYGPLCFEKSVMEGEQIFPLTQEGIQQIRQWLQQQIFAENH